MKISAALSVDELEQVCHSKPDLAVIDVGPQEIRATLKTLRGSSAHTSIPVLVAAARLDCEPGLFGVLSQYCAMPCSPAEMIRLVRRLTMPMAVKEVRHCL